MYNREIIEKLVDFVSARDGNTDKARLQNEVQDAFDLVKERGSKMKRYNRRVAKMKLKDKDRNDYWIEEDEYYE